MFKDYWKYDWVLPVYRYEGLEPLLATLADKVISPAEGNVNALQERRRMIQAEMAHQALARAVLHAPAELQWWFIAAGHSLDAFAAVGKALGSATTDIFIVDPYSDAKLLTDYAVLAPDNVSVRVLAGAIYRTSLKPAAEHWLSADEATSRRAARRTAQSA